ncbi:MAG: CDP-alcohol phosphatidyltransferase family protein [Polyangiaceae bacterium]|nr:CDP-alcohol phosphatidyltransferase family protein [Polyangiaceae bacterium]
MSGFQIYLQTRKKNDQLWNHYFMRPLAGYVVAAVARTNITPNQLTLLNLFLFVVSAALLIALPDYRGGLISVGVLELSYLLDCSDGMLARHKKLASKTGHLFDFFTDELKAVLLAGALGIRAYRTGGFGFDLTRWNGGDHRFLFAAVAAVAIIASATSLTNFVRRPELTGQDTPVDAHYETVKVAKPEGIVRWVGWAVTTFLRFLNHYPSHIWAWAVWGPMEVFFWVYSAINLLYLGRGWLGLVVRFGRFKS